MKAHLQDEPDKFFGDNVSVILYDREPLTVFEGFYDIGVMTYCSMHCCGGDK